MKYGAEVLRRCRRDASRQTVGGEPGCPYTEEVPEKLPRAHIPLWLLVGLLSVVNLMAVGVLTYFLGNTRARQAMDRVAVSYRGLGFQAVENKVTGMLGQVATMTKLLGEQAATAPRGEVYPVELRKQLFLGMPMMPIAMDYFVGFSTGELLDIHRDAGAPMLWELSNHLTGYRIGGFSASSWGPDWLSTAGNMTIKEAPYNATMRSWYLAAEQRHTSDVFFGPVYLALNPFGVSLVVPAVYPVTRPGTTGIFAVAVTNVLLQSLDDFLKAIVADLLEGTVVFLVERQSGALLASSIPGQALVGSHDPVSGAAQVVLAQEASDAGIRGIACAAVDPVSGWARFGASRGEDVQTGSYYARVGPVKMPGLDWVLVVGTERSVWMSHIDSGVPLTVGL
eukprot:RCo016181